MDEESSPNLLAPERRDALMVILRTEGRIDVAQAAKRLGTSNETIRKDLIALADQDLLRRVHGGALPAHSVVFEERVEKRTQHLDEKLRIALEAVTEIPARGAIFIDSGSTTSVFADMIPNNPGLTVFTNSIPVVQALFQKPRVPCFMTGGRVRDLSQSTVGKWALEAMGEIRVDVAFVGTNAVSFTRGLSAPDADEAVIKGSMLEHAERSILLADHSKFDQDSMFAYSSLDDVDLVITGEEVSADHRAQLAEQNVMVVYA